ncbi:MAG: formylglycine-generating enzyme family protein [Candidatus Binatia bacterium]
MKKVAPSLIPTWLQHHSPWWTITLGAIVGVGIGVGALVGVTGVVGMALCLLVLAGAVWWGRDAEPVLVGLAVEPEPPIQPQEAQSKAETVTEPEPESFSEPLDMVELHGGTFLMGSPDSDRDAFDNEKPQHEVSVSAFYISLYLITRHLYRDIVGSAPKEWDRDSDDQQFPANYVNWFAAVVFCNALSQRVGLSPCYRIDGSHVEWDPAADGYRLPTEAEWEYACRAGTSSKWFFGDDPPELGSYAWYSANSGSKVHPIGQKKPNIWGIHDMIGNVWEWCWDWYGDYPVDLTQTFNDPTGPEEGMRRARY